MLNICLFHVAFIHNNNKHDIYIATFTRGCKALEKEKNREPEGQGRGGGTLEKPRLHASREKLSLEGLFKRGETS